MRILYRPECNIDLGLLNRSHPFDGRKFEKVFRAISSGRAANILAPEYPIDEVAVNAFVDPPMRRLIKGKRYIQRALEQPYVPQLPFGTIDRRVLLPMRWAVAGTIKGATLALNGESCRNLSGGYHHASRSAAKLAAALGQVDGGFKLAFVVAGTDVLASDRLGGLKLTIEECVQRDRLVEEKLRSLSVPWVFVAGGGYSRDSSRAMITSLLDEKVSAA